MQYRMSDTARAVVKIQTREHIDYDADLSYLEQDYNEPSIPPAEAERYRAQDRERLEAYQRGEWHCVGIDARAELIVDHVAQEITSGGLWGIESDSDDAYLHEVAGEELASLARILRTLGFTADELRDHWPDGFDFPA